MTGSITSGEIVTNDGVTLRYSEAGTGPDLLLLSGWTLTAELWKPYLTRLAETHHVVAYDHRGHGASQSPAYGYRVARLAADTREIVTQLGLTDVTLIGHSMGCAVAFSYWDLFGGDDLARLVLIDQTAVVAGRPDWPTGLQAQLGTFIDAEDVPSFAAGLRGPDAGAQLTGLVGSMVTPTWPEPERAHVQRQMMTMDRDAAATLLFDNVLQDFRDVAGRIDIPVLVIGGEASVFPAAAMRNLARSIPGGTAHIIAADDGGSHLAVFENPDRVIELIRDFARLPEPRGSGNAVIRV